MNLFKSTLCFIEQSWTSGPIRTAFLPNEAPKLLPVAMAPGGLRGRSLVPVNRQFNAAAHTVRIRDNVNLREPYNKIQGSTCHTFF